MIQPNERVDAYAVLGATPEQVETYRFHLALNDNCTMIWHRRSHFTEVEIGNQYTPGMITLLRRMCGRGLTSSVLNFRAFVELEELNLSK